MMPLRLMLIHLLNAESHSNQAMWYLSTCRDNGAHWAGCMYILVTLPSKFPWKMFHPFVWRLFGQGLITWLNNWMLVDLQIDNMQLLHQVSCFCLRPTLSFLYSSIGIKSNGAPTFSISFPFPVRKNSWWDTFYRRGYFKLCQSRK